MAYIASVVWGKPGIHSGADAKYQQQLPAAHQAQIKAANHGNPPATPKVFMPKITHLYGCLLFIAIRAGM